MDQVKSHFLKDCIHSLICPLLAISKIAGISDPFQTQKLYPLDLGVSGL